MIKAKSVLVLYCLLLILLNSSCNQKYQKEDSTLYSPLDKNYTSGHSIGLKNTSNEEHFFLSDSVLYKINNYTEKIERQTQLEETNSINFTYAIDNGNIFYCKSNSFSDSTAENGEIWYKNITTNTNIKISNDWCNSIVCDGENIYYFCKSNDQNSFSTALKRYNIKSKTLESYTHTINNVYMCNILLYNGFIYYTDRGLFRINKDDINSNPELVTAINAYQDFSYILRLNNKIFYTDLNNSVGGEICYFDIDTGKTTSLVTGKDNLLDFCIYNNKLFYFYNDNLYMVDLNGQNEKLILKNYKATDTFILNGKLFSGEYKSKEDNEINGKYLLKSIDLITGKIQEYNLN